MNEAFVSPIRSAIRDLLASRGEAARIRRVMDFGTLVARLKELG